MGFYLNATSAYGLFREACSLTYFVDKTEILCDLVPLVELNRNVSEQSGTDLGKSPKYVCITRPRRFGKTVMANMIASFFGKGVDSSGEFDRLKVSGYPWYRKHLNQHNVIHIMFNEMPQNCKFYDSYLSRIQSLLMDDLQMMYPHVRLREDEAVWDALRKIYEYCDRERFIFIFDEWDFIYHQDFASDEEKQAFTKFLSNLLKDKAYVEMAYMTRILPITRYSSGSEFNMFFEFSMATMAKYSEYFDFTDEEVDVLHQKYIECQTEPKVTRAGRELWYDGYQTASGRRLYNTHFVVGALSFNQI